MEAMEVQSLMLSNEGKIIFSSKGKLLLTGRSTQYTLNKKSGILRVLGASEALCYYRIGRLRFDVSGLLIYDCEFVSGPRSSNVEHNLFM